MGASQLLRGVAVSVHSHDVNVGVAEQLVDDPGVVEEAAQAHQHRTVWAAGAARYSGGQCSAGHQPQLS